MAVGGVLSALFLVLVGSLAWTTVAGRDVPDAGEVARYEGAVRPFLAKGGEVVQLGIRVGLRDLSSEHMQAPAQVAEQAAIWTGDLEEVRRRLSEVDVPDALGTVHRRFLQAVEMYRRAAVLVGEAARADGEARDRLLDQVAETGNKADAVYDDAAERLQAARRKAGLRPSPDFPGYD